MVVHFNQWKGAYKISALTSMTKISHKNIRATALEEFWGTEFEDSIYLWEGAKHNLTFSEINALNIPTMDDLYMTPEKVAQAHEYCKCIYFKLLPMLTKKLNEVHNMDLPVTFWRTVFGLWLFRHICIVYEKFMYLSEIDIDKVSVKLLERASFYIPHDHLDYFLCFTNDFGVQQLVSEYFYLFKRRSFSIIARKYNPALEEMETTKSNKVKTKLNLIKITKSLMKQVLLKSKNHFLPKKDLFETDLKIALCGVYFSSNVYKELTEKSKGQIQRIALPDVNAGDKPVDYKKRERLTNLKAESDFEYFLTQSFYYCLPMMFLEQFPDYYDVSLKDIKSKKFTHIVSENWISHIPSSIYVAIAQHMGKRLIGYEHCVSHTLYKTNLLWVEYLTTDKYLTTGWKGNHANIVQGGFAGRNITPYEFKPWKKDILFICHAGTIYLHQFADVVLSNSNYIKDLRFVRDFIDSLPEYMRQCFMLRPRKEEFLWDTEYTWETKRKGIRISRGVFSEDVSNARIVVVDNMSTGLAEILLMNVPMILIHKKKIEQISEEYEEIFTSLVECGVVCYSVESAISRLEMIYEDVQQWWNSEAVQVAVNKLISKTLAPPSKGIDYLMSCLEQNHASAVDKDY